MRDQSISCIADVSRLLSSKNHKLFGIGGFPSTRSEVWPFVPDYDVICSNKTGEFESVSRNVRVEVFEKKKKPIPYPVKKPFLLLSDKRVRSFIRKKSKGKKVGIYIYQPTAELEKICKRSAWKMLANPTSLYKKMDSRSEFFGILKELNIRRNYIETPLSSFSEKIDDIFKKLGEKIVIQLSDEGGGRGTMIFAKKDRGSIVSQIESRLKLIKKEGENPVLFVSSFVTGPAISLTGCITRANGVLSSYCQYQLIDIPEVTRNKEDATGIFCGHDWSLSKEIPDSIHRKARKLLEKIGLSLKRRGALGIFGLDLMWDKKTNTLLPLEINLRLLGTFPTSVYVQLEKREVPLVAFHLLDFLKIPYKISSSLVFRKGARREGAHLILFNPLGEDANCQAGLRGGVYCLRNKRLMFIRLGAELKYIINKGEFILTEGVPEKDAVYRKNGKLLKIITREAISKNGGKTLNSFGKNIVNAVYQALNLKPYEKG